MLCRYVLDEISCNPRPRFNRLEKCSQVFFELIWDMINGRYPKINQCNFRYISRNLNHITNL